MRMLLVFVLAIAGCGGLDEDDDAAAPPADAGMDLSLRRPCWRGFQTRTCACPSDPDHPLWQADDSQCAAAGCRPECASEPCLPAAGGVDCTSPNNRRCTTRPVCWCTDYSSRNPIAHGVYEMWTGDCSGRSDPAINRYCAPICRECGMERSPSECLCAPLGRWDCR